jgi:hypothetical protein
MADSRVAIACGSRGRGWRNRANGLPAWAARPLLLQQHVRIVPPLSLLLLALLSSVAGAEVRLGARAGGGLEAGPIGGKPHPVGIGEVGLAAEWLQRVEPGVRMGLGVVLETVARQGHDLSRYEETKLDVMFRLGLDGARIGTGMGARLLATEPREGPAPPPRWGIDWVRLDVVIPLARAQHRGAFIDVEGYIAWTCGCYLGRTRAYAVEGPERMREVGCGESLSITTVLGFQLALTNR